MEEYITQLQKSKELGLAKNIGVSNFTIDQIKKTIAILGSSDEIFTNQIEVHPYLQNAKVVDFCQANNILVSAYMPLA